jgi:hypothetical protein
VKLNTLDHPKTFDLADRLGIGLAQTLGHLTLLWAFTGRKAPQGNIGKWPDGAIARACDWQGDSKMFVEALTEAGYLDNDTSHRLLVHDWPDHAERWVRASLKKAGQDFISPSTGRTTERTTEATIEASPCPDLTRPVKDIARTRAHQLPDNFNPQDSHQALAAKLGVDLQAEFDQFRDYHQAKGSTMKDWSKALNTWIRNAKKFGGTNEASRKLSAVDRVKANIAARHPQG